MTSMEEMKEEVAYFMRRLYTQKLTTTSGGNISMKLSDGSVLITPSGSDKGRMRGPEIGRMDLEGDIIGDPFKPTIESRMHLEIYKRRPDVTAVVHAHPVTTSALAATDWKINSRLLAESHAILGEIAYADYFTMGSPELADAVAEQAAKADCVIMRNHGALAVGKTLLAAFDRLEVLDAAARITVLADHVMRGHAKKLSPAQMSVLDEMMGR